ncbi:MAG: dihydroxyacetone kinase subunit L [Alphaproteobacteria bacterium]|nr:dihydroxyacetone kinase subunit L [Alphaproteobacteria bacterium]
MNAAGIRDRLIAVCDAVLASEEQLTRADQAIGDGDHGVGMARGCTAARVALQTKPAIAISDPFKTAGLAILMTAGGASGAVFGTFFTGMAKSLEGDKLTAAGYAQALREAMTAIQARGGARPGDKTMLDALAPAIEAAAGKATLAEAMSAAADAAEAGAHATAGMIATTGKAKTLGERSLGYEDPGAISLSIILRALAGHNRL